jgi:hypothetical protein
MKGNNNMKKTTKINHTRCDASAINTLSGGLPVRTNLRAGLAWDDIDDQAKDLWGKLTSAVSGAVNSVTGNTTTTTTK